MGFTSGILRHRGVEDVVIFGDGVGVTDSDSERT